MLRVRVIPNASRSEIMGWHDDGCLKLKVQSPPEGGRANKEACALLARILELPKKSVTVESGQKHRIKIIAIKEVSADAIKKRLVRE